MRPGFVPRVTSFLRNILTQKGQHSGMVFQTLVDPYDYPELLEKSEQEFKKIEILSTANMFLLGHRVCLDIKGLDVPSGTAGLNNIEFICNHVCSSKTVTHSVNHNAEYPSYPLLPVIPLTASV